MNVYTHKIKQHAGISSKVLSRNGINNLQDLTKFVQPVQDARDLSSLLESTYDLMDILEYRGLHATDCKEVSKLTH